MATDARNKTNTRLNINEKEILFLTPTVGSIWLFYQQFLIDKHFPNSKRILINGNHRWDFTLGKNCVWYDFIDIAIKHSFTHKYFVHIDEDCFMFEKQGIFECIERLELENASLIGPTDNMWPIRGANPNAINSFFMVGKIQDLKAVWDSFNTELRFNQLDLPRPNVPEQEIETEPYYNFFWNYLNQGFSIAHIKAGYEEQFNSTTLPQLNGKVFCHHMWYTRYWYKKMKFVTLTHRKRYLLMKKFLDSKYDISTIKLLSKIDLSKYSLILFDLIITKNTRRFFRLIKHN